MTKHVLVTGGAGYVGSHACKALSQAGYTPVCFDNLVYGHEWAVRWGPLERGSILDPKALADAFRKYCPVAVMHFAGFAYVGESVTQPQKYYQNNVVGTLTLLDVMLAHDIRKIVFSSSCATYGIPAANPISESHPQNPVSPYGASKLMAERMLIDFYNAYGLKSASLRYFNAAGADPGLDIGEAHDPETHLIPLVLHVAAGRKPSIAVFGRDYPTADGTCIRDYVHVSDLAAAHVLALQALDASETPLQLNLGTGNGVSVLQVINAAKQITGRAIEMEVVGRRPGDPAELIADATRAKFVLGWAPALSSVETQIEHAWKWYLKYCS